ncbi:MAG: hypothetical protein B1H04_06510, partial [Planctomycetales bacterium 4484_123]
EQVARTIQAEETSFNRTLDRGLELFERVAAGAKGQIAGEVAFELYATYGFPIDLTQLMAAERGLKVDMAGYEREMARHREISSASEAFQAAAVTGLPATDDSAKYEPTALEAKVLGWVVGESFLTEPPLSAGAEAAVVLDRTNFYAEAGGQVGDVGTLSWPGGRFAVRDTKYAGHCVLHIGRLEAGTLAAGQTVTAEVDPIREDTRRNHTATHLLNWALRRVLGAGVNQAGSVVEPARLRFDFTHNAALSAEQLLEVERLVNERVLADEPVYVNWYPLAQARQIPGVRAVFGEKYPDPVRVVSVAVADPLKQADESALVEFCGGTHLDRTGQVGFFKVVSEESVARGVRRITAVTGHEAVRYVQRLDQAAREAALALRVPVEQVPRRVEALLAEVKRLRKRPAASGAGAFRAEYSLQTPSGRVLIGTADAADAAALRGLCDMERQKGVAAMMVGAADGGKVVLVAMVREELVKAGLAKAGDWVAVAAKAVGGGGGGKPTMAQAGGRDPARLPEALRAGRDWIAQRLGAGQ